MRHKLSAVANKSTIRFLGIALLAGGAAGCSSDSSRFMYRATDGLTTASVRAPSSSGLSPVGEIPNAQPQAGQNIYGGASAPQQVSQSFPGDYRAPSVSAQDNVYTGSIPGSVARSTASSSSILGTGAAVSRAPLATPSPKLSAAASAARVPVAQATKPVTEKLSQPFPTRPSASATIASAKIAGDAGVDDIVTGTVPSAPAVSAAQPNGWTTAGGTRVTLGQGETLYNLSKRYGVPVNEIMKVNGISDASKVHAGQNLVIPIFVYSKAAPVSAPDSDPRVKASRSSQGMMGEADPNHIPTPSNAPDRQVAILPTAPSLRDKPAASTSQAASPVAASNAAASGVYVVKSGDTLTKIARENGVSVDALKQANGLSAANIRIGQSLKIPGGGTDSMTTASVQPKAAAPATYTAPQTAAAPKTDSITREAKASPAAAAPAATGIGKLRWPVRGQVITGFAKTENGKRNDGIDLSVPVGTPIKAAENGVVIYSSDGLKDFGNTVLVRHDDGLVTVYAHASKLNVKRGDKVSRGDVIAESGMSGLAKTPRLHFEVRKNSTPVNPGTYLE